MQPTSETTLLTSVRLQQQTFIMNPFSHQVVLAQHYFATKLHKISTKLINFSKYIQEKGLIINTSDNNNVSSEWALPLQNYVTMFYRSMQ